MTGAIVELAEHLGIVSCPTELASNFERCVAPSHCRQRAAEPATRPPSPPAPTSLSSTGEAGDPAGKRDQFAELLTDLFVDDADVLAGLAAGSWAIAAADVFELRHANTQHR